MNWPCHQVVVTVIAIAISIMSRSVVGLASSSSAVANQKAVSGLVFYWFRLGDMRLHDNPGLARAAAICTESQSKLVPVFCFDPRIFGSSARGEFGSLKCGPRRAKFILESVQDLRQSLEEKGSKLVLTSERPEDFFARLLGDLKKSPSSVRTKLIYQEEPCSEETDVARKVRKLFQSSEAVWGSTLYELTDLPYESKLLEMPDTFTPFRNLVEKKSTIRAPLTVPKQYPSFPTEEEFPVSQEHLTTLPTLETLGYTKDQVEHADFDDPRGVMTFKGGETAALERVKNYIWDKDLLRTYFDTRNGMIGADYSSKFSPWLAHGNLSPRFVASECKKYEEARVANKSTYWLVFELLWRDFFKFFAVKHGDSIFLPGGTIGSNKEWKHHEKSFVAWVEGRTGFPLVDANMRELAATGFMSNRGRQNVCSFLALELNLDWRLGAEYFESILLDHDVHSNYGNWCAGAGMTGGRLNRFNIVKQSKDYDQHGDYVRLWLPELKDVPTEFIHEPWKMNNFQQTEYSCRIGVDYPNPIAKPYYASPKNDSKAHGDNKSRAGGRKGNDSSSVNSHRGRGQRNDMKSLRRGNYEITG